MKKNLLIVDDDEEIRTQLKWAIGKDCDVHLASDRREALELFRRVHPAVTMLDLGLPPRPNDPEEGFAALSEMLAHRESAKVLVISGQGERENALRAVNSGAWDFLCKPVDVEELRLLVKRALFVAELEEDYRRLQRESEPDCFEGMLGSSPAMRDVFTMIRKVASSTAPVLILGESGTGKEMTASAIHRQSPRRKGPFVAINCNAIPENLIESELFGHEKGSFTGATSQRKGLFETAEGGTLFLDEIGELPPPIQVKLLRFLQEKRIQRVGGRQEIEVDARVVAATNANLEGAVAQGTFREDLFFRLAVVVVNLPPLRKREDDLIRIATDFLDRFGAQDGRPGLSFSPEAVAALRSHPWPGNVRELQNRVRRSVLMADGKRVSAADLDLAPGDHPTATGTSLRDAREAAEREAVTDALRRHSGKIAAAAVSLGISRPTLYELMDKLGIQR